MNHAACMQSASKNVGICYEKVTKDSNSCLNPGWWGAGADGKGGLGDPAKYADGTVAWQCANDEKDEDEKTAESGTDKGEIKTVPCRITGYVKCGMEKGIKIWRQEGIANTSNLCGTRIQYTLGKNPCGENK